MSRRRFTKKGPDSVSGGIRRPGALTALVGGPPGQNMGAVQKLAQGGSPLQKKEALYFLNVLSKRGG